MIKKFNDYGKVNEGEATEEGGYYSEPGTNGFNNRVDNLRHILNNYNIKYTKEISDKLDEFILLINQPRQLW